MTVAAARSVDAPVGSVTVAAASIPTETPESDGTLEWRSTTIVVVQVEAAGETGVGWTYAPDAAGRLVERELAPVLRGRSALDVAGANLALREALRNAGLPGLGAMALSAVDVALWDLKARLLELPLVSLLGAVHDAVPVYGSGGFCSYSDARLAAQLRGWVEEGIPRVKMKVGREPERDAERVRAAREAIGDEPELFVDANGAFGAKEALRHAETFAAFDVTWFEEPVSSNDVDGLRLVRERGPAGMDVAAGEYASTPTDFRRLLGAVDCLQADATRCGGITGLLAAAALAEAHELDLSGHTAPGIHTHALCAVAKLRHLEWFHDHVRIERLLFEGFPDPSGGSVRPDLGRLGHGLELRRSLLERYAG